MSPPISTSLALIITFLSLANLVSPFTIPTGHTLSHLTVTSLPFPSSKSDCRTGLSATTGGSIGSNTKSNVLGDPICTYFEVQIPTSQVGQPPRQAISVEDLTPKIISLLSESGMINGSINVISRHTTTAITINERESRLAQDMEKYFLSLAPPDERSSASTAQKDIRYFHNDIDKRPDSAEEAQRCRENGWDIDNEDELQAWRDQEPINAHSHLLSMLLGSSETIPVVNGGMVIGQVRVKKKQLYSIFF
jgi:thiamine phosphate synthase YjbQ (UPF0047 family)